MAVFPGTPRHARRDLALFAMNIVETPYPQMERLVEQLSTILLPGGRFCVLMQDGLLRAVDKGATGYDAAIGLVTGVNQAPGHDPVRVDSVFWTVGFARHVVERRFVLHRCDPVPRGRFWLVFLNRS